MAPEHRKCSGRGEDTFFKSRTRQIQVDVPVGTGRATQGQTPRCCIAAAHPPCIAPPAGAKWCCTWRGHSEQSATLQPNGHPGIVPCCRKLDRQQGLPAHPGAARPLQRRRSARQTGPSPLPGTTRCRPGGRLQPPAGLWRYPLRLLAAPLRILLLRWLLAPAVEPVLVGGRGRCRCSLCDAACVGLPPPQAPPILATALSVDWRFEGGLGLSAGTTVCSLVSTAIMVLVKRQDFSLAFYAKFGFDLTHAHANTM